MPRSGRLGGIIHSYQKYDPRNFPSPTQPPPDLVSNAFDHFMMYGEYRELTEEELARAVRIDASMIAGLGPSLEALRQMLLERKRKILSTYETEQVRQKAQRQVHDLSDNIKLPKSMKSALEQAVVEESIPDLERLWYKSGGERSSAHRAILSLIERVGQKYQVDELAARYEFTGSQPMTIPLALEVKQELEQIDRLLKQLEEALKSAQIGIIDLEELAQFAEPRDVEQLNALAQQIQEHLREMAEQQGLEKTKRGYQLTPKAYRLFQGKLLERIFSSLMPSSTGRHQGPVMGEGAVELTTTKEYEFGDSVAQMDITASLTNCMIRGGTNMPLRLRSEDIVIHRTKNSPKCATVVLMDMSGSMRYDGLYMNVKRMALALEGLIRGEYPGDFLQFVEVYTFAKHRHASEIVTLMPKPVTIFDPYVRLRADLSRMDVSEMQIPQHFTNLQHGMLLARKLLANQNTPNKQIFLITDGLPTAHFEGEWLYMLYPADTRTEQATLREGAACHRDGIVINLFLLPSWSQSREDVQFAYRLAESTKGRVFFTSGKDLDRFVVWDYLNRRRSILA